MQDAGDASTSHIALYLLVALLVTSLAGCMSEPESGGPPSPNHASGPDPETVVTDANGHVRTMATPRPDPKPSVPIPIAFGLDVNRLTFAEVPIHEDFAKRGYAAGLEPVHYQASTDLNDVVTAYVFAFESLAGNLTHRTGPDTTLRTALDDARHFWTAAVVKPDPALRNPDASLHLVLLDVFSTDARLSSLIERWSPASRTAAQHIELMTTETAAGIAVHAEGPYGFRLTTEVAFPMLNETSRTVRIFGIQDYQVTGFLDLQLADRVRQAGHGVAAKPDPSEITFPPTAGFARLERPILGSSFDMTLAYTALDTPPQLPEDDGPRLVPSVADVN